MDGASEYTNFWYIAGSLASYYNLDLVSSLKVLSSFSSSYGLVLVLIYDITSRYVLYTDLITL